MGKKAKKPLTAESVRGAWRVGYEAGFEDGLLHSRREGWRVPQSAADLPEGAVIKITARLMMTGEIGVMARVVLACGNTVHAHRLDCLEDDPNGMVDICVDQCLVKSPTGEEA